MEVFRVSSDTRPVSVAGAIAAVIQNDGSVELQSIGAGATHQAVKAVAIARGYLAPVGLDIICTPAFMTVKVGETERTGIRMIIETR